MKKSFFMFGMGAALLAGLTSCQSSKNGGYTYEEAMPMSEFIAPDGNLPDWAVEGNDDIQVAAGETTDRNNFPIPEGAVASSSQNQPDIAANGKQNQPDLASTEGDVIVEENPADIIPTPLPTEHAVATPKADSGSSSAVAHTATANKPKKPASKTQSKKPDKPTLIVCKVKKGDNLTLIAKRCNTTVEEIRKASGIKGDKIYAGQTIKVPYTPDGYKAVNGGNNGKATKETVVKATGSSYVIKKGDTISGIAARNGISASELMKANNLTPQQASKIRAGQKLTIPGKAAAPAAKANAKTTAKSKATAKPKSSAKPAKKSSKR